MRKSTVTLSDILREHGHSTTKQRRVVFDALFHQEPMTMTELYRSTHGQLDRASIYRTIELFEKLGIATRVAIGWKYKIELSDIFSEHHHHLTCLKCHKIIPINKNELEQFIMHLAKENCFLALEHQVEIQGHCQECAKSAPQIKGDTQED